MAIVNGSPKVTGRAVQYGVTWLSRPRKMSIMKKRQAHRGDKGIMVTALGYAINASPGPEGHKHNQVEERIRLTCYRLLWDTQ